MDKPLRIGDVVCLTARVMSLRGDGSVVVEPVGFDYDVQLPDHANCAPDDVEVDIYSVDPPTLVRRGVARGDKLGCVDGDAWYEYWEDLHDGKHLLKRFLRGHTVEGPYAWEVHGWDFVSQLERLD